MKSFSDEEWRGPTKIILGIDVGTTHSAVSFAHLFKGGLQKVQYVTNWPGQPKHSPGSKIPTLIYYDQHNKATCFGADALKRDNIDRAEDEGWSLAKHFKLHLHPQSMQAHHMEQKLQIEPLPLGVSLATIYTDFFRYLLQHTQNHFKKSIVNGKDDWEKCSTNMLIVLTHPNGWSTREQQFLRKALYNVSPSYQSCQVTFVTEGEASVHFSMFHSGMGANLQPDTALIVCDAGGSTVDTTAYYVEETVPLLKIRESKASSCIQTGGVFVDLEFKNYMAKLLARTGSDEESIKERVAVAVEDFEANAKKEFESPDASFSIGFQDNSFKNTELEIKRGRMKLEGRIIQSFFEPVVSNAISDVKEQMQGHDPKHLLLVGGFGQNEYLRHQMSNWCGLEVTKIDAFTSKAAADGAVIWGTKHAVIGRVTRASYGTNVHVPYDPLNPDHQGRKVIPRVTGNSTVDWRWSPIINKGVLLTSQETRERQYRTDYKLSAFANYQEHSHDLWVFHGDPQDNPGWVRDANGNINPGFELHCILKADMDDIKFATAFKEMEGPGGSYRRLQYSIVMEVGGTELSARLQWVEDGAIKRGPVTIISDPVRTVSS